MIQRVDHVNLVVDDMPAMIRFYRDLLGLRLAREATIGGSWIDAVTGLRQVEADVAYLEMPDGPRIELIRYRTPKGTRPCGQGAPNALGLRHLAFRAQDLDRMAEALKVAGVELLGKIQEVPQTQVDYAGLRKRLLYFHDPEGNLLELCAFE